MMGQANVWYRYMDIRYQPAIDRYQHEVKRLFTVLDTRLTDRDYLVDEYSIADIAHWPWIRTHWWSGVEISDLPNLTAWVERLARRPACQRGINAPPIIVDTQNDEDEFINNARAILVK
jgi:glutathione S-transferase